MGTSYFWEGIRSGTRLGLAVGVGTFVVALAAILLGLNPLNGATGMSVALVEVYALFAWFVLIIFSLTAWTSAEGRLGVQKAFTDGGRLVLEELASAVWLVVQAVGWTLLIDPALVDDLEWVSASVDTSAGELAVEWEREEDESYELDVMVPWNGRATVRLPDAAGASVTESGTDIADAAPEGVSAVERDGDDVVLGVGAGSYAFSVTE